MTKYVLGFAFTKSYKQVLLIKKARPDWQAGKLNGVGGHIEKTKISFGTIYNPSFAIADELPINAMAREFKEETGLELKKWEQFAVMVGKDFEVFCFTSNGITKKMLEELKTHDMKDEPVQAFPLKDFQVILNKDSEVGISNLSWLIGMAMDPDNKRFHAIIRYDFKK